MTSLLITREYQALITALVSSGLASDQHGVARREHAGGRVTVEAGPPQQGRNWLKPRRYEDVFAEESEARRFAARMLDGALLQLAYTFDREQLAGARLAFLPSPNLLEYQNNAELYEEEALYADVVDPRVVTVPLRFDYDPTVAVPLDHPSSHLTLGNYEGCRIAVSAPVAPLLFGNFIVRSFYRSALEGYTDHAPPRALRLASCIHADELEYIHVGLPT